MKSIFAVAFVFIYAILIASIAVSLYIFLQWKTDLGLILLGVNSYIFIRVTKLAINQH
jgi:hypothetical protein